MPKRKIPKPYSELTPAERVAEAHKAIARLEATLYTGNNRGGTYGDTCRSAIRRWQAVIDAGGTF